MDATSDLPIGRFSAMTRISVRMLRHYDEYGVLVPADVDPVTGYRRYTWDQLAQAVLIRNLRDAGLGVAAIAALVADPGSPAYAASLKLHREQLVVDLRTAHQRLALLDHLIDSKESRMSPITITDQVVPATTLATFRRTVATYSDEGTLWQAFMPLIQEQGPSALGPGGVIEHDDEFKESDVDESVFLPVAPGTQVTAPVELVTWPERRVVVATLVGPYSEISRAHDAIADHLAAQGLEMADHCYNRYLTDPSQVPPEQAVTEVCCPVR